MSSAEVSFVTQADTQSIDLASETYAIYMPRQTINDILQRILRGRTELYWHTTILSSLRPINVLTSLFLLGTTAVLILTVFRRSFKSLMSKPASAVISDIGPQRLGENGTSSNPMKKTRPFGGKQKFVSFLVFHFPFLPLRVSVCLPAGSGNNNESYLLMLFFCYTEWDPVVFRYPLVEACPRSLTEIKPIPYRPFRWGAYQYAFLLSLFAPLSVILVVLRWE